MYKYLDPLDGSIFIEGYLGLRLVVSGIRDNSHFCGDPNVDNKGFSVKYVILNSNLRYGQKEKF